MAMNIGGAMPYSLVPPTTDNSNESMYEDKRQQSYEEPNAQANYEQWKNRA